METRRRSKSVDLMTEGSLGLPASGFFELKEFFNYGSSDLSGIPQTRNGIRYGKTETRVRRPHMVGTGFAACLRINKGRVFALKRHGQTPSRL